MGKRSSSGVGGPETCAGAGAGPRSAVQASEAGEDFRARAISGDPVIAGRRMARSARATNPDDRRRKKAARTAPAIARARVLLLLAGDAAGTGRRIPIQSPAAAPTKSPR